MAAPPVSEMDKPLVLAHRGASAYAPENTLAAFLLARELGADGIELDVQLSRDGVPVVMHDETVERTTGARGRVREMRIIDLKQLDAAAMFVRDDGERPYAGERIPTLAEVFDALEGWLKPVGRTRPAVINVELKGSSLFDDRLERTVANLLEKQDLVERVLVSSFHVLSLYKIRRYNPLIPLGLLYDSKSHGNWFRILVGPQAMHPEHTLVDVQLMEWANRKRLGVNTWTVDEPDEARRLTRLGVTSIMTNVPDVIRDALGPPAANRE
jgi:glycerophosphoryl diester phosphodiesterase